MKVNLDKDVTNESGEGKDLKLRNSEGLSLQFQGSIQNKNRVKIVLKVRFFFFNYFIQNKKLQ